MITRMVHGSTNSVSVSGLRTKTEENETDRVELFSIKIY